MGFADNYENQSNNTVRGNTKLTTQRKNNPKGNIYDYVASDSVQLAAAQKVVDGFDAKLKDLDKQIADRRALIKEYQENDPGFSYDNLYSQLTKLLNTRRTTQTDRNNAVKTRDFWKNKISEQANAAENNRVNNLSTQARTNAANGGANGGAQTAPRLTGDTDMAKVNLSAARELYFKGNEQFIKETVDIEGYMPSSSVAGGSFNSPTFSSAFASFETAQNLWRSGKATKGRIQTWLPPANKTTHYLPTSSDQSFKDRTIDIDRRIFQFHYNPGSISMAYNGVPDIDVTMYTSGLEKFNLWNQSKSTISFELVLNRMPDMKYIDPKEAGYKKKGIDYKTKVYDRTPITTELQEIYDKGTMYDVEFLLRVLLGYRLKSQLRGGKFTSDIGWITPRPVELHLGSSLRYLVNVVDLTLNHVIFNERMVPLFTTVRITGTRIPDYDGNVQNA